MNTCDNFSWNELPHLPAELSCSETFGPRKVNPPEAVQPEVEHAFTVPVTCRAPKRADLKTARPSVPVCCRPHNERTNHRLVFTSSNLSLNQVLSKAIGVFYEKGRTPMKLLRRLAQGGILAALLALVLLPSSAFANTPSRVIDFATFLKEVENANYSYDGRGVTVEWSPSSACTDNRPGHTCLLGEGTHTPRRQQRATRTGQQRPIPAVLRQRCGLHQKCYLHLQTRRL